MFLLLVAGCSSGAHRGPGRRAGTDPAELMPILAQWCGDGPAAGAPWSAVADDDAEWRALRARLGPVAACFGSDFVPPPGSRVLVVVAPGGLHAAAAGVEVATEEGVDVLTFSTVAVEVLRTPAWVLVVPARRQQLAIVLAMPAPGYAVPIESLVEVFEPR